MSIQDFHICAPAKAPRSYLFYEDLAGKVVLLAFFLWLLHGSVSTVAALLAQAQHDLGWAMALTARVSSMVFVGLVFWLTISRTPPVDTAPGWEARVSSFLGTFILMSLIGIPGAPIGPVQSTIATVLIIVGTVSSIWCLWWLGKAFSIMATARSLVTSGPYRHVRHPLYTAEAITVIGAILSNGSALALLVGGLQFYFQYRRILNEEAVLGRAFPDYAGYRAITPMIMPRLR